MRAPGSSGAQCNGRGACSCPAQPSARATAQTATDAAPAARKRGRGLGGRAAGGDDVVDAGRRAGPRRPRGLRAKAPRRLSARCRAIEPDLRRALRESGAAPARRARRSSRRDTTRAISCDWLKPRSTSRRRVQRHGHDQCRRVARRLLPRRRLRDHPRAEDARIGERAFVLERLHQLRHRELVGPRGDAAASTAGRARGSARNHRLALLRRLAVVSRGQATTPAGSGTTGISASQSAHRSNAGRCPGRRHRTHRGGSSHPPSGR